MERKSIFKLLAACCLALALSACTGSPTQGTTAASPSVSQSWVAGGAEGRINVAFTEFTSIEGDLVAAVKASDAGGIVAVKSRVGPVASIFEQESRDCGDAEMSGYLSKYASDLRLLGDALTDVGFSLLLGDRSGISAGSKRATRIKTKLDADSENIQTWFTNNG
jgi:hypothetical protein